MRPPSDDDGFGFTVSVDGGADKSVRDIIGALGDLQGAIGKAISHMDGLDKAGTEAISKVQKGAGGAGGAFNHLSEALQNANESMAGISDALIGTMRDVMTQGIKTAAHVEESNARLRFGLSKIALDYTKVSDRIDEVSLKTILTRTELQGMVSDLALQKVNVFDDALENLSYTAVDGSKVATTAVEAMADAVAFSGKNVQRVIFGVKEAVSDGKLVAGKYLADDLNLNKKEVQEWNKELSKAKTNQEKFNKLMEMTAARVGGVTGAVGNTLNFTMQQVGDWIEKVNSEVFKGALPVIRDLLNDIGKWVLELVKPGNLDGIREAVTDIVKSLVGVARRMFEVVKWTSAFVAKHPWLLKVAGYLTMALGAMAGMAAAVGGAAAAFMGFKAILGIVLPMLTAMKALFISAFTVALPLALKFLAIGGLIVLVVGNILKKLLGGKDLLDTWERLKMVFTGIWEGLRSMANGQATLSKKTADSLQSMGLLDFVWGFLRVVNRVKELFVSTYDTFMSYWPKIAEIGSGIWTRISGSLSRFMDLFGFAKVETVAGADSAMSSWTQAGASIGDALAFLVIGLMTVVDWITKVVDGIVSIIEWGAKAGTALEKFATDTAVFFGVEEEAPASFVASSAMAARTTSGLASVTTSPTAAAVAGAADRGMLGMSRAFGAADASPATTQTESTRYAPPGTVSLDPKSMRELARILGGPAGVKITLDGVNVVEAIERRKQGMKEDGE